MLGINYQEMKQGPQWEWFPFRITVIIFRLWIQSKIDTLLSHPKLDHDIPWLSEPPPVPWPVPWLRSSSVQLLITISFATLSASNEPIRCRSSDSVKRRRGCLGFLHVGTTTIVGGVGRVKNWPSNLCKEYGDQWTLFKFPSENLWNLIILKIIEGWETEWKAIRPWTRSQHQETN